jgi:hypothetical protein
MTSFFPRHWRLLSLALVASLAIAAFAVVAETPARATTGTPAGLPPPEKKMDVDWGHPLVGRNLIIKVSRGAHIRAGVMDIEAETEGEPEWFYGEILLHLYQNGKAMVVTESVYPFTYTGRHHVTASLIPEATINERHPYGIANGTITFTVAKPSKEYKNASEEPMYLKASFKLNGGGPYQMEFKRRSGNAPPALTLPKAQQIGK